MTEQDLERYVEDFELAWQRHGHADVARFLPPTDHPQFEEIAVELIRCDMELSWQDDDLRRIDDYRKKFPNILGKNRNLDPVAFEEYRLRTQAGDSVTPDEYQERYQIKTYHWPELVPEQETTEAETANISGLPTAEIDDRTEPFEHDISSRWRSSKGFPDLTTVESRLHKRLRLISLTFAVLLIYLALLSFANPEEKVGLFLEGDFLVGLNTFCLAACVAITTLLWFRKSISLYYLRIFEVCLFGLILLELSAGLYSDLFLDHELEKPLQDEHELFHYSSSWSLPFFALIIAYGTLVPSSWRRCTIIVSVIAITPVIICTLAASMEKGLNPIFLRSFLLQMVLWMGMAAAIAIYGVHRLETLEKRFSKSGKLGKYRLIKQLGSGGMGSIYLAEDTLLTRYCAVKLMLQHRAADPKLFSRFEREVKVLAAISHSNVVRIFDFGHSDGGIFYYVMEYLEGSNLDHLVKKRGRLNAPEVLDLLQQVCGALKQVHDHGLVHRDIKPGNIFACETEDAPVYKLLDFGLVKTAGLESDDDQLTQDGAIIGTPAFMSPEQASGEMLDIRSDIYSLGAVAYYLLIGNPPFDKNSIVETLSAHIHETPTAPRDLRPETPEILSDVICRCLEKDREARFESVQQLQSVLDQIEQ